MLMVDFKEWKVIKQAVKMLPILKYFVGVATIVGLASIIVGYIKVDYKVSVITIFFMLIFAIVLFYFSRMITQTKTERRIFQQIFNWFVLILVLAAIGLIFTSIFFKYPDPLGWHSVNETTDSTRELPIDTLPQKDSSKNLSSEKNNSLKDTTSTHIDSIQKPPGRPTEKPKKQDQVIERKRSDKSQPIAYQDDKQMKPDKTFRNGVCWGLYKFKNNLKEPIVLYVAEAITRFEANLNIAPNQEENTEPLWIINGKSSAEECYEESCMYKFYFKTIGSDIRYGSIYLKVQAGESKYFVINEDNLVLKPNKPVIDVITKPWGY